MKDQAQSAANQTESAAAVTVGQTKVSMNPATLLAPVPVVLVSCRGLPDGERAKANLITIAWAGTICSDPPMLAISVRKSRYSHEQIRQTGEFVVNLVGQDLLRSADLCGVKSGFDLDKFAICDLTAVSQPGLTYAPAVAESPVNLACRVRQVIELGSHDCFLADIIGVTVAENLFDRQKKLDLGRANLIAYTHGEYRQLGAVVGFFGYSVASPQVLARRLPLAKPAGKQRATGKKKAP